MRRTVTVRNGQSLLDIAIQEAGLVERAIAIAFANGISITDTLTTGLGLQLPLNADNVDTVLLAHYNSNEIKPASALKDDLLHGIGIDAIGVNFKIGS